MTKYPNYMLNFLNKCYELEHEFTNQIIGNYKAKENMRILDDLCKYGNVVLSLYANNDPDILQILNEQIENESLIKEIRIALEQECNNINCTIENDRINRIHYEHTINEIEDLNAIPIEEWISKHMSFLDEHLTINSFEQKKALVYFYYAIKNYRNDRDSIYNSDINILQTIYSDKFDKQSQFSKYGLIPIIDDKREILVTNPPYIYDRELNKTFRIKNIPFNLLTILNSMKQQNLIQDISLRVYNDLGYNGKVETTYLQEALEFGMKFELSNLGSKSISKLYSQNYNNCLWIVIDEQNITFEELCDDENCYNDMLITQVIHLQYNKQSLITHIDHEYIFYSIEEYIERQKNSNQKGTAKTRMKSFKIDNSSIPFDYKCEIKRKDSKGNDLPIEQIQILYYILECYFTHIDLLKEYFSK